MKKIIFLTTLICLIGIVEAVKISDGSQVLRGQVEKVVHPKTVDELVRLIKNSNKPLSVAGGRYSQGAQVWYKNGIVVDITGLNNILDLNIEKKTITVQSGITWRGIQEVITRFGLSIKVMQSYNDFTVGGSLSVNVHGRDVAYGALVDTVEQVKVLCADGVERIASRTKNSDLFSAAIGGYGAVGIITQATLSLADNCPIDRVVKCLSLHDYNEYFFKEIHNNPQVVFHNAQVYPLRDNDVLAITWYKTGKSLTVHKHLMPVKKNYFGELVVQKTIAYLPGAKKLRLFLEKNWYKKSSLVVWRNYEMSQTVKSLEPPSKEAATQILQEYFVPMDKLEAFMNGLRYIVKEYYVNLLNVSIRYVPKDTETILSFAPQDSFAIVLFFNVFRLGKKTKTYKVTQRWTQKLINHTLSLGGTYYLPYAPFATREQFQQAYPGYKKFIKIKKQYDPETKFLNSFLQKYVL